MHTTDLGSSNVPAFLTKLWKIVEDPTYNELISWNQNGRSFIIKNQSQFSKELLPLYFKHSNMASFIRQLNMYGFRKTPNIENSGLRTEKDEMEFYHQYFIKGQERLLELIKRKATLPIPTKNNQEEVPTKQEEMKEMLTDMKALQVRQDSVDSLLTNMQKENESLWREVAVLRQKHQKQQKIVEKLIQFLLTLVHNRGLVNNHNLKRKAPLMIDNTDENSALGESGHISNQIRGPVIHDVTDDILETDLETNANSNPIITSGIIGELSPNPQALVDETSSTALYNPNETLELLDPFSKDLESVPDVIPSATDILNEATAGISDTNNDSLSVGSVKTLCNPSPLNTPPVSPDLLKGNEAHELVPSTSTNDVLGPLTKDIFSEQVDGIENELNWFQSQLSDPNFQLDTSTLLGLFSHDNSFGLQNIIPSSMMNSNQSSGQELVQYNNSSNIPLSMDFDLSHVATTEAPLNSLINFQSQELPNFHDQTEEKNVAPTSTVNSTTVTPSLIDINVDNSLLNGNDSLLDYVTPNLEDSTSDFNPEDLILPLDTDLLANLKSPSNPPAPQNPRKKRKRN